MKEKKMKIVAAFALEDEVVPIVWPGADVKTIVTGIGKVQAAISVAKAILCERPQLVMNVGTAGTLDHQVGDILVCTRFIDRDLKGISIQGIVSELDTSNAVSLRFPSVISGMEEKVEQRIVSTGDNFVTTESPHDGDVVDMEAFAEAMACVEAEGVQFFSVKYVTDIIGQNSVNAWKEKLAAAREGLDTYFRKYLQERS